MTETKDYDTPTVSEREAVERERAAFLAGAQFPDEWRSLAMQLPSAANGDFNGCLSRAVLARYPLPKRQRPLRVTLSGGSIWSMACDGKMVCHGPKNSNDPTHYPIVVETWRAASNLATAEDCEKFARCLRGEREDVPDDE